MFEQDSGLSRYVKWIMNSEFPASNLLNPDDFLKYLEKRGLSLTINNLEFFDKTGVLRPILRVVTPSIDKNNPIARNQYSDADIFALKYYYSLGLIELPKDGDYQPWSDYLENSKCRCLYYHPYQLLQAEQLISVITWQFNNWSINDSSSDFHADIIRTIGWKKELIVKTWIPWIGLLILLDDMYGRLVKTQIPFNAYDITSRSERNNKKEEWIKKFSPNRILLLSGMKIEDIEQYYEWLSFQAENIDPLSQWFIIQQLVKVSRRYQLRHKALLAQEYYGYLFMLGSFIYDLSRKKMLDPDDILDGEEGKWKGRIFGEPFDYRTKKTQNQILKYFLYERPFELVILVEGETEEKIIELILQARAVDLERDGFFVYNIQGQGNLQHLKPLFRVSQLIDITIFAMLDKDKDIHNKIKRMKESAGALGYNKEIIIRIWDRDFETENFGIDKVLEQINQILDKEGYQKVIKEDVENRMKSSDDALISAIESEIGRLNHDKFDGSTRKASDIISKPYLATLLIEQRLNEIQIKDDPEWKAILPIEVELKEAFRLIPRYL
jgi:hypothetical protein